METPNTRARRKRERELEAGSGVGWRLDGGLRNELLGQAAEDPLPLPAPTQRAPPFGSSSFTGDRPAPKRSRRLVSRSLSVPSPALSERTKLDELLDRFLDQSLQSTATLQTPSSRASTACTNTGSTGRSLPSAGRRSAPSRILADRTNARPVAASTSLPYSKGSAIPLRATKSAPRSVTKLVEERPRPRRAQPPRPEAPSPLAVRGAPPPPNPRAASRVASTPTRQPARSAPPARHTMATRSTPLRNTRSAAALTAHTPLPAQPSSDGDTSIDSLDMAFQCGGEDIDRLFQVMDTRR